MSQENVEKVRRAIEEFRAGLEGGDPGAFFDLDFVTDDYEWVVAQAFEGREVWTGREEFVEFVRSWTEQLDDWSPQVDRLIDAGDNRVVALVHQSATGKESGVPVEWEMGLRAGGRTDGPRYELPQPSRSPRRRRAVGVGSRA